MKCQVCKKQEATHAWQPFGPDTTPYWFTALGWHERGFPVIRVCDNCKAEIEWSKTDSPCKFSFFFTYKQTPYYLMLGKIQECPF